MNELPVVMTLKQLGEFLDVDKGELSKALREGRIPGAYRAGKRWFIARDRFLRAATSTYGNSTPVVR